MTDPLVLDEPSVKKQKIDDFGGDWRFMGGADDLPDELLDTGPSTSNAVPNHNSPLPSHPPPYNNGLPNGTTTPMAINSQQQFGGGFNPTYMMAMSQQRPPMDQHQNQPVFNAGGPSTATNTNSGGSSSVLEELLTNRSSNTAPQSQQSTTNQMAFANQQRPPAPQMTNYQTRPLAPTSSTSVNRLGSPPNIQVMARSMSGYPTSESYLSAGPGGLPGMGGGAPGTMPPQYRPPMQADQQFMAANGGNRPPVSNGQKMNPAGAATFVRMPRPPSTGNLMLANGTIPGGGGPPLQHQQQRFPTQQQMNAAAQMHHMRMNGPSMNHQQYPQELHPSQIHPGAPPYSVAGPMGHAPQPPPGMRPRMPHQDLGVGASPRLTGPFSPPMGMQQSNERGVAPGARMQYSTPPNPNVLNNLANVDMFSNSVPNGMPMQHQPSSASIPQSSPSMLMSPQNISGILNMSNSNCDPMAGCGAGAASGAPQDPEKRKLIQQQLVLLLHAMKCQQRERTNEQAACSLPHCGTMKNVLVHMGSCAEGRSCTIPHCASSRQILCHWRSCTRADCPVCSPLRQMTDRNGRANGPAGSVAMVNGHSMLDGPSMNDLAGGRLLSDAQQIRQILDINPSSVQPLITTGNRHLSTSQDSDDSVRAGSNFTPQLPAPETASVQKEWHRQVTLDLRNHLVSKLVKAIFPSPDPAAMQDQRIRDLIQYARKVEKEMFETASDREEYYHLLAEKIYKIQKELQEKKQRRLEQQQGRLQTMSGQGQGSVSSLSNYEMNGNGSNSSMNGAGPGSTQGPQIKMEDGQVPSDPAATSKPAPTYVNVDNVKQEPLDSGNEEKPTASSSSTDATSKDSRPIKNAFTPEELAAELYPVWEKLYSIDDAIPFREPVDPILLQIPDYFDVIKHPMDLSTIRTKLDQLEYKDPWQFCDDMWLMFDNAWTYNRKASKVYKYCTKLSEMFMDLMDPVMRSLGLCCSRRLSFTPLALVCYGQAMCSIPRDAMYYYYEDNKSQFGVGSEKYTYCKKCFEELPGDSINMGDDPNSSENLIPKKNFKQLKNDQIEYEPYVDCTDCGRKWHKICALHVEQIYPGGFVCETCVKSKGKHRSENRLTAKRLPQCKLSQHLEKRVNEFLRKRLPPETPAGDVVIRVLSSSDKEVEVKPHMKAKYCATGEIQEKFPYKAKAIFAFEVIDGVEVCFFGLHVQEYGSNCAPPNQRRVYIAYLDSVHFFTPKFVRTQVYHEILLGYLAYVKQLGYTMAHIWACPPSEGDDYIFHCHPPEMKIPKPKRLQEWYKKLLDRGVVERIVTDYKDIYDFYLREEPLTSVTELPLFEGDYWPNIIEECMREVEAEEAARRREAEAQAAAAASGSNDDGEDDMDEIFHPGKKRPQSNKKHKNKSKSATKKTKKSGNGTGNDLTDKVMTALEKHKEVFFVVRLYTKQSAAALPPITDSDANINCEFMDGRDTFLSTARDRHWEFSSLRRAKYSTMALCYELHNQGADKFDYQCNTCKNTNASWHCAVCEDFDLCQGCYEKSKHQHKMERIKSIMGDDGAASQDGKSSQNPRDRTEMIQAVVQTLAHASQCRDANCRRMKCQRMKRVTQHLKFCKALHPGGGGNACQLCRQIQNLCIMHARQCQDAGCQVPMCQAIRKKLAEHQAQLRKKREREMMRRINLMSNHNAMPTTAGGAGFSGAGPSTPYQQTLSPVPSINVGPPAYNQATYQQHGQQQPMSQVNPAAVRAARDIERIAQQQVQFGGGGLTFQQRPPGSGGMAMMRPTQPMAAMPPAPITGSMLQQPWDGGGPPRPYHQQQQPHFSNAMAQPTMGPVGAAGGNEGRNSAQLQQQVQMVLHRLKAARTNEEKQAIMTSMRGDPQLFSLILQLKQRSQENNQQQPQPAPQHQQHVWNGPPIQQHPQPQSAQQAAANQYFAPRHGTPNSYEKW